MNSRRKSLQGGDGGRMRGEKSENREEEERGRMLPCLFLDLHWFHCTGLAKSGAELPSPPLSYLGLNALIHFSFNLLLIDLNHIE